MAGLWRRRSVQRSEMSPEFQQAMKQEILRTELIRIKALIGTTVLLGGILLAVYLFAPEAVSKVWHGNLKPHYLYSIMVPFILFELWVHSVITRHLELHQDLPVFRRYLGALIETSMPTIALALHIDSMGQVEALGFVVPMRDRVPALGDGERSGGCCARGTSRS